MKLSSALLPPACCLAAVLCASQGYGSAAGAGVAAQKEAPVAAIEGETAGGKPEKLLVYVGTYTGPKSKGIYRMHLDLATGQLSPAEVAAETPSPSFLALHPSGRFLYAANEVADFQGKNGSISAFALDPKTGGLTFLNKQSSHGDGPCHLIVDRAGKNVLLANYGAGSIACLPIGADGKLGDATAAIQHQGSSVDKSRQEGPHAHSINLDHDNRFAFAADLGLDKVLVYRFNPGKGTLVPNNPPSASVDPGSGPRHFAFHPKGRTAYVINEMKSTVTAFTYDPKAGMLTPMQTLSTLPAGFTGNTSCAEVQVHPSGKFLYGSNRGHDSIATFKIDAATGRLTATGHQSTGGKTPRNFSIDPTGKYLLAANQGSDNIVVFKINPDTGALTPTGQSVEVPSPVCVKMLPAP